MRRLIPTVAITILSVLGLGAIVMATGSGSSITAPRLERAVVASFANVYSQRAALLGQHGVTPATMDTKAMCDKGPNVAQSGPGSTWNCLLSWTDPNEPMPATGYGKFELNVHGNGCF